MYRSASSAGSYAQIPVQRTEVRFLLMLSEPPDRLSCRTYQPTESPSSSRPCRLPTVRTEGHIFCRPWSHPHQMPARCVRHRYHRSVLHNYRRQCRMLSYAVFHRLLRHSQIMAHTLYIPDLFRQRFPGHRKCPRPERYHTAPAPYNKPCHPLSFLPLHMSRPDLHRAPRWTEVSTGWSSMQECMHLRPLPGI